MDDSDLRYVHPPRRKSIGARSDPYGPARVNVYDMQGALVSTTFVDNMYLKERLAHDESSGRASMDPGLFYRFRYGRDVEFICLDTSLVIRLPS